MRPATNMESYAGWLVYRVRSARGRALLRLGCGQGEVQRLEVLAVAGASAEGGK